MLLTSRSYRARAAASSVSSENLSVVKSEEPPLDMARPRRRELRERPALGLRRHAGRGERAEQRSTAPHAICACRMPKNQENLLVIWSYQQLFFFIFCSLACDTASWRQHEPSAIKCACRMPHVACRMPHVACRMPHVACRIPHAPHAACRMPYAACRMPYTTYRMPHFVFLACWYVTPPSGGMRHPA